jgi:hypothetical protein
LLSILKKTNDRNGRWICLYRKNGEWILENLTDKDHIRGAFKAYRKACFKQMGGLKVGWDTVDELLSTFYGWKVLTID